MLQLPWLYSSYGPSAQVLSNEIDIDRLFPPASEADNSTSTESESVITPGNEKRVFAFGAKPEDARELEPGPLERDDLACELPIIPNSPFQYSRSSLSGAASPNKHANMPFRARAVPDTTSQPSITPRLSRAAKLRLGISISEHTSTRPPSNAKEIDVRPPVTPPKSLAEPVVMPRSTTASVLRTEGEEDGTTIVKPASARRQSSVTSERSVGYEGMPGFGGRAFSVASTSQSPVNCLLYCPKIS